MSSIATRYGALMGALATRFDRLAAASAGERGERDLQWHAIALALGGPLLVSAFIWMVLPAIAGIAATLIFTCVSFGLAIAMTLVAMSGRAAIAIQGTLAVAAAQLAVLIFACGGIQSPAAALLLALPIEARIAHRDRPPVALALALMALSALGAAVLGHGASAVPVVTGWHWLFPAIYAVLVVARTGMRRPAAASAAQQASPLLADVETDALSLRLAGNGDVVAVGEGSEAIVGIGAEMLAGTGLFERIHVADRVAFLCALADLRDGASARRLELRLRGVGDGGGRYRPFLLLLRPIPAQPQPVFAGVLRDHSEVAGLRAALAVAEEATKGLEIAKGHFLASVSHELRTPLNSIIGFSDMLMCEVHGSFANERQKENVGIIREAGLHLLGVVNSILDVSKIEAGSYAITPEPFRLDDAVSLCCQMMRLQAEGKAVTLKPALPQALGEVNADRRAVQQMLINLISNAVKFTPAGGTVGIGAAKIGRRLHFWVSDTGIGIAEADLERIGQPFTQIQNDYTRQYDGVGLGLVLVKGLVSLHEGTMSIDSALGAGTTVTITLPIEGPARVEDAGRGAYRINAETGTHGTFRKTG
ncbi:MAG: PAS domain-containing sensor histidine kinase [Rhizobiaceae bacterium]|nr:PAS domain-containing sensor histidine kinase [Rhizobiaceae bacterium]